MPFESDAQRKYLYSQKPDVAAKFAAHSDKRKHLERKVKKGLKKAFPKK